MLKNNKKTNNLTSIIVGSFVNVIIIITSIYLYFKSGVCSTIDTALLVLCILFIIRKLTLKNAVSAEIVARGSTTMARDAACLIAVVIIFNGKASNSELIKFLILLIVSSTLGILYFSTFYENFNDEEKFPFPTVKPRIDLFKSFNKNTRNNGLFLSLSLTSIYSFFTNIIKIIPKSFKLFDIFSFENNPLIVASGYILGYKTYLIMGIGFIYSLVIYKMFNDADFSSHLMNGYIFSVIVSFVLTEAAISIYDEIRTKLKSKKDTKKKFDLKQFVSSKSFIVFISFLLFNIVFFSKLVNPENSMSFWIFLILVPLTIASSSSTLVSVGETGFWFSILEDVLPILIILFTFTKNVSSIILVLCSMEMFESSGIYFILNSRFSDKFNVSKKKNILLNIISNIVGSVFCILIVLLFKSTFKLGSESMPVPGAQTLGLTIKGLIASISTHVIPSYINIKVILIASVICIILEKINISPMIIVGGITLPFSTFITMSLGALLSFILKKRGKELRPVFSGMATADGFITSISTIMKFFKL